jgi:hypothetical protein
MRWAVAATLVILAGAPAGLALGAYATGQGAVGLLERGAPRPPLTRWSTDQDAEFADALPAQDPGPRTITCVGCGPGLEERRMIAEQQAYDRYLARMEAQTSAYVPIVEDDGAEPAVEVRAVRQDAAYAVADEITPPVQVD